MIPNDVFGLSEVIEGFTFREKGGVKILKKWREEAVIMQVDIEIVSVSRTQFLNFGSIPSSGFYGYANLIMRDFSLPSIAIVQPRQTLYYAVNEFAQSAWMEFSQMARIQENFKGVEQLICFNTGLLGGACVNKECKPIPQPSFIEFPLRELFVNTYFGTQFKIELSYWKINDLLDNCGDLVEPKSNQNDGDKDEGLPPFGVMPIQATDSANPYNGLPAASPWDREGVIELSRLNDLSKPNPDNFPDSFGYFARVVWRNNQSAAPYNCQAVTFTFYRLVPSGTTGAIAIPTGQTEAGCNSTREVFNLVAQPSGQIIATLGAISLTATIVRAASLPPDEPEIIG